MGKRELVQPIADRERLAAVRTRIDLAVGFFVDDPAAGRRGVILTALTEQDGLPFDRRLLRGGCLIHIGV